MADQLPSFVHFYAAGEIAQVPENRRRFVTCFTEAWEGIPVEDRGFVEAGLQSKLTVQLRDRHRSFKSGPTCDAVAQYIYFLDAHELRFKSSATRDLSDESC